MEYLDYVNQGFDEEEEESQLNFYLHPEDMFSSGVVMRFKFRENGWMVTVYIHHVGWF